MRYISIAATLSIVIIFAAGCTRDATSPAGFRLPDGDAENGRAAFVYMECHECHKVKGEKFPPLEYADPPYVELGGSVTRVKTYGELVTAIINPSHELAKGYAAEMVSDDGVSKMPNYNSFMTVQELTDLVVFLQTHYDVMVPDYSYRVYPR